MMERTDTKAYLSEGIIAYIGNKRRLLPLIGGALTRAAGGSLEGLRFTDLFSGSAVVSRYARTLGMQVTSNDWEPYARVLSEAWLKPVPDDIIRIFGSSGGLEDAVDRMNNLSVPRKDEEYLARYYAPSSMNPDEADYRTERLFYTRENALRLDAARNFLDKGACRDNSLACSLLLAPIIYGAATRVNTSGVFKAFHKGFGGHGKDALKRIITPIEFKAPLVIDAPPGRVFSEDANTLAAGGAIDDTDIVYLDPPYNQHQYGSNYHLLNTLVHWDKIPEPMDLGIDGRLLRKAGIRTDWKKTKSSYCYRNTALQAFNELMDSLQAPLVLLSYSTDGIIPFKELQKRCEAYGRVRLAANPYITYRGGRQSNKRQDRNLEFVLIVEKGKKTYSRDKKAVESVLLERRLQLLLTDLYRPESLLLHGTVKDSEWEVKLPSSHIRIPTRHLVKILDFPSSNTPEDEDLRALIKILESCRCENRDDELTVIEHAWINHPGDCKDLVKTIPRVLKKMAHRKYHEQFSKHLDEIRRIGGNNPEDFSLISSELNRIENQVRLRLRD